MKNKYIILIIFLILIIIGAGLIISFNVNQNNQQNDTTNNRQKNPISINNSTDDNSNVIKENSARSIDYKGIISKNSNDSSSEFTAEEAMNAVKKLPSDPTEQEIIVIKPKYKNEIGWLVPMRYKYNEEFAGSVYVASSNGPYYNGPKTFKDYKEVISKKK